VSVKPVQRERGQVLGHRGRRQRSEINRADGRQPEQLGHERPERMPAMHVVGSVRRDNGDPFRVQHPAEEGHQVASGLIGPVHVLQHEQHRVGRGQLRQQAEHGAEQLLLDKTRHVAAGRLALVPVWQQP
jgi:hypothetical protein